MDGATLARIEGDNINGDRDTNDVQALIDEIRRLQAREEELAQALERLSIVVEFLDDSEDASHRPCQSSTLKSALAIAQRLTMSGITPRSA